MPRSRTPPEYVLVEGENDKHVIQNLCKRHGLTTIKVRPPNEDNDDNGASGIDELLKGIPQRLIAPDARTIGIVVDADQDLLARWQALRTRLLTAKYVSITKEPLPNGWISTETTLPRVGIWLMPDNRLPGMLEDFVSSLIPPDDLLITKAKSIMQEIEREGLHRYSLMHHPKALIHTWLAWQKYPGQQMGLAITAQTLSHDSPTALAFVAWLRRLFDTHPTSEVV